VKEYLLSMLIFSRSTFRWSSSVYVWEMQWTCSLWSNEPNTSC